MKTLPSFQRVVFKKGGAFAKNGTTLGSKIFEAFSAKMINQFFLNAVKDVNALLIVQILLYNSNISLIHLFRQEKSESRAALFSLYE